MASSQETPISTSQVLYTVPKEISSRIVKTAQSVTSTYAPFYDRFIKKVSGNTGNTSTGQLGAVWLKELAALNVWLDCEFPKMTEDEKTELVNRQPTFVPHFDLVDGIYKLKRKPEAVAPVREQIHITGTSIELLTYLSLVRDTSERLLELEEFYADVHAAIGLLTSAKDITDAVVTTFPDRLMKELCPSLYNRWDYASQWFTKLSQSRNACIDELNGIVKDQARASPNTYEKTLLLTLGYALVDHTDRFARAQNAHIRLCLDLRTITNSMLTVYCLKNGLWLWKTLNVPDEETGPYLARFWSTTFSHYMIHRTEDHILPPKSLYPEPVEPETDDATVGAAA